jgi:hypothetical protein
MIRAVGNYAMMTVLYVDHRLREETVLEFLNILRGLRTELSYRPFRRYDNPIPTQFQAPIDCSKIPALCESTKFFISLCGAMNFMATLGIRILITNSCTRCR